MTDTLTAPPRIALTLAERVTLVEEFALYADNVLTDWTVRLDPDVAGAMVLRWDRLTITVADLGDLELARRVAVERARGTSYVRLIVAQARHSLGWGRGAPLVRCSGCHTRAVAAEQHAPGSAECRQTRDERVLAQSD